MPIYSANRVSTVEKIDESAKSEVVNEAKSYPEILMDIQKNSMSIFEAIIMSDLHSIKAIAEGTMLESEVLLLEDEAKKSAKEVLLGMIEAAWKKINSLYDAACDKIAQVIADHRNNRFKRFKEDIEKSGINVIELVKELPEDLKLIISYDINNVGKLPEFKTVLEKYGNKEDVNIKDIQLAILCDAYGIEKNDIVSLNHAVIEKAISGKKFAFDKHHVDEAEAIIKDNKEILNIKRDKKEAKRELDNAVKEIKNSDVNYNNLNIIVAAYQSALTARTNLVINITKQKINDAMRFVGNLALIANKKSNKKGKVEEANAEVVNTESAIIDCIEFMNEATSLMPSVFFSDEIVAEATKIVEEAEAAAEAEFCAQNK